MKGGNREDRKFYVYFWKGGRNGNSYTKMKNWNKGEDAEIRQRGCDWEHMLVELLDRMGQEEKRMFPLMMTDSCKRCFWNKITHLPHIKWQGQIQILRKCGHDRVYLYEHHRHSSVNWCFLQLKQDITEVARSSLSKLDVRDLKTLQTEMFHLLYCERAKAHSKAVLLRILPCRFHKA